MKPIHHPLHHKRFLSLLLALVMLASVFAVPAAQAESQADVSPLAAAAAASGDTPERIRDGVILHAFDWNLNVIEENLQAIKDAGYTAIQTSPIMGSAAGVNWYFAYQPSNMEAGGNRNRYGDRDAFVRLTTAAEQVGLKVIVDVVPNHMGSPANSDAPWTDSTHFHDVGGNVGYNDRFLLTQPQMISGLRDLNTHSPFVQESYIAYLKDMIDAGASGFRYDAIKHIELDDDVPSPASMAAGATNARYPGGEFKSDYVKNVTGAAEAYFEEKGKENFQYGEVLQGGDPNNDRMAGYAKYIDLTASMYGHHVRGVLELGDIGRLDKWADYAAEGLKADQLVPWVESHDTYNNEGESLGFSPKQIRQGWAMIAARKDASPLFFARNINADGSQRTSVRTADNVDNSRPQWTHPEVVAINKFHNAMAGNDENLVSLGNNAVMIERGTVTDGGGAVLINTSATDRVLGSVPVTFLKDGFYVDALNSANVFTVANGRISGTIPGNPATTSTTDTSTNPGLVVLMERDAASSAILAAMPNDDDVIAGNSFTGNELRLRLSAVGVTDTLYTINNGEAKRFANDETITVSGNYNDPITVTMAGKTAGGHWITKEFAYTRVELHEEAAPPVEEPTHVDVYFSINRHANFQAWGGYSYGVRVYTFNPELFGGWPGGTMTRMKYNGVDTHWYKIRMLRVTAGGIIFNTQSNAGAQQQTNQPAITASMLNNEQLYFYGSNANNFNINGSADSGNNARANWDTAFAAGNGIGFEASGIFPPGRNGVIFNTSGGSTIATQYVRDGEQATRPTTDPTRSGYLFDGKWYTDAALTQVYDFANPVVNTLGDDHIYGMTLYAGWIELEADKFLVDFNTQGGSLVMSIPNVAGDSTITAPEAPVRNGYAFAGWFKDSEGTQAWTFETDTVTASTTLYAKWNVVPYNIDYRDGEVSAVMPGTVPTTYTVESPTFDLSDPSPKEGYTFDGWYTDSQFLPSSKLSSVATGSTRDLTLHARFKANTSRITLDSQSGSGGTEMVTVNYGGRLPLGIARPEREGYSFQGFYTETEGKGQQMYNSSGIRVFEGNVTHTSDRVLYAHWILAGEEVEVDRSTLEQDIRTAQALHDGAVEGTQPGQYPTGAKATLQAAIATATAVYDQSSATQQQVDEAVTALTAAVQGFRNAINPVIIPVNPGTPGVTVDKSVLQTTLRDAQSLHDQAVAGTEAGQYPASAKAALQTAITAAQAVNSSSSATQTAVNQADAELKNQMSAFRAQVIAVEPGNPEEPEEPQNPSLPSFTDIGGHWGEAAIMESVALGFVNGYPDGTFHPNQQVTRLEFTTMLARALRLAEPAQTALDFADASRIPAWAAPSVTAAVQAGWITGYEDRTFRGTNPITRQEMASLIIRALGSQVNAEAELTFADSFSVQNWAKGYVAAAVEQGLMQGQGNNRFAPMANATRAEAATVILNLLKLQSEA
ncbi:InlB B-repeat-containing protein [Paenibacillus daejeonensis]|uniref:InlB B-repeat-containing protein n=1 Tax=Paenibacillus daejeonensis TaxID=135193 RepID=UPI000360B236|nr:InlB B-repeat-containing protein [Paenibacillus daejeonensis]